jgi:uncharacterized protein DUF6702
MREAFHILSLVSLSLLAFAPGASAHRYHTSVTRLEYNAAEHLAEITVQTFADDIEAALSKRSAGNIRLDGSTKTNALVLDYLSTVFELRSGGAVVELQWIGIELKGHTVWIYLQAKAPEGLAKSSLRHQLLFDLFADQVNIVNVLNDGKRASLVFKRGDAPKEIP